jgi:hypothetical protein
MKPETQKRLDKHFPIILASILILAAVPSVWFGFRVYSWAHGDWLSKWAWAVVSFFISELLILIGLFLVLLGLEFVPAFGRGVLAGAWKGLLPGLVFGALFGGLRGLIPICAFVTFVSALVEGAKSFRGAWKAAYYGNVGNITLSQATIR